MTLTLTKAHVDLLRLVKGTKSRPTTQSDDWERFLDLSDWGLVEDLGMGNARITPEGRRALKGQPR